jgi:hypothetical protein
VQRRQAYVGVDLTVARRGPRCRDDYRRGDEKGHRMSLLTPTLPDFDLDDWARQPYRRRLRMMCQDWALNGFGSPPAVYAFYLLKMALYVGGWAFFVSLTPGLGGLSDVGSWWSQPIAFQKLVLWTLLFEVLGLGCASGPLTFRFFPPMGGALYWLRPGTTRLPPFPRRLPFTSGHRRTVVDVALYLGLLVVAFRVLAGPELSRAALLPVVLLLPVIGLRDKTIFLAARSEVYWFYLIVFLFPADLLSGSKIVQLAVWWGAASSKLNRHFASVITVMVSNSPFLRWRRLRRAMYRRYPDDLRPSKLAHALAHGGTAVEYTFPLVLILSSGGWATTVALAVMVVFHLYILFSVPMGVPLEWNVFTIYAGLFLFGAHADVSLLAVSSPLLVGLFVAALLVGPVLGNLKPALVSFLPSMRYYAGNWGTSLWLFRKGCEQRLDEHLVKTSPIVQRQLARFYDETTTRALVGKALAFRAMHLHGRALNDLLPRAVDDVEDYEVHDGEWIAGVVVGWNFGEGHLHHDQLLDAVQAQCGFQEGELRCIFVESQPFHAPRHHWRIVDAATGLIAEGDVNVGDLLASQPWPDGDDEITSGRLPTTGERVGRYTGRPVQ